MFCDGKGSLLRALGVHVLATFATLHPLLPGVGVLLVGVQVDALGEALEADEAEVRLLPAVDQLVPLKFRRGGEPLVTKLTGVLFNCCFHKPTFIDNIVIYRKLICH